MAEVTADARVVARGVSVGYSDRSVISDLDVAIPTGELITVIVGPNACGKSTLLRSLARMLPVSDGVVELDGAPIGSYAAKEVARRLGMLPNRRSPRRAFYVEDLVARGRYPHQGLLRQWSEADEAAVALALERAGVAALAERGIDELSGGQRQRVWIAMALAQQTPILFLDEPTTYLDIAHQVEVLDLARSLQQEGYTVVVVLHELNLAFRYATHLIVMKAGGIVAEGTVADVVTAELIEDVYGLPCRLIPDPETGTPLVVPRGRPGGEGAVRASVDAGADAR